MPVCVMQGRSWGEYEKESACSLGGSTEVLPVSQKSLKEGREAKDRWCFLLHRQEVNYEMITVLTVWWGADVLNPGGIRGRDNWLFVLGLPSVPRKIIGALCNVACFRPGRKCPEVQRAYAYILKMKELLTLLFSSVCSKDRWRVMDFPWHGMCIV